MNVGNKTEALHILVVDDERDIREGSQRILSRMGFQVSMASRGDEALKMLAEVPAAIMLLDLKMPGMDGMEVLTRVHKMDAEILVVVITGYATVETAIQAMKQGAYDFIPKPFEPDQLRIIINRAAEKIRLKTEAQKLAREQHRTLLDLAMEKSRIRTVIESLPNGVVVTNNAGQVALMNPAFKHLMGLSNEFEFGQPIDAYIKDPGLCELIMDISKGKHIDYEDIPSYEFTPASETYLLAEAQPVIGEKSQCLGAVVNLVDITAIKVLDRLKSEFVAKVSHELRSPLSTIHEQLAVVLNDMVEVAPRDNQKILARAKEKTHGLISLIGDLLDLSRIEEGVICTEPKPVKIDVLLEDIIQFLQSKAASKKQSIGLKRLAADIPPVQADPLALESIFGNLIANAINYTPEGGTIKVQVDIAGINLRVKVVDTGFGIEEKHLDKIFNRFYRVKTDKTRFITGTGLGLPIVKELITSLNGFIDVESVPGKGSTFTVLLPVKT
ncbi:MAG: response regulator [Deltaproteobacteria bacterium]|nr:response regulator [Deltaproteobacteria bacterium]